MPFDRDEDPETYRRCKATEERSILALWRQRHGERVDLLGRLAGDAFHTRVVLGRGPAQPSPWVRHPAARASRSRRPAAAQRARAGRS